LAAIGSGKAADPRHANEIAFKIKSLTSKSTPVLYGGSVDSANARTFLDEEHLNGFLVGTASLDPVEFAKICQ
jgi:triosephosphate isomerase